MSQQSNRHPRVSVVIPTYNHAHFLGRAIVSALCQTFQDFEVIVVDDASDDDTAQVIERLRDPRVRLVRLPKHGGAARARNVGIAQARGEWIAFLDSDDEWLPEKLERQLAWLDGDGDPKTALVYCPYYRQGTGGECVVRPKREPRQGDALDALLTGKGIPTTSAYLVRRSALLAIGGFDETLASAQDLDLLLRLAQASHRFAVVPEPLFVKHDHGGRQIATDPFAKLQGFRAIARRWGPLMTRRMGAAAYQERYRRRSRKVWKLHRRCVAEIVASGSRPDALRYAWRMVPFLPWGARFTAKALAFALMGRRGATRMASPKTRAARQHETPG